MERRDTDKIQVIRFQPVEVEISKAELSEGDIVCVERDTKMREKMLKVYGLIARHHEQHGFGMTIVEISESVCTVDEDYKDSIPSKSVVSYWLNDLHTSGYIHKTDNISRGIVPLVPISEIPFLNEGEVDLYNSQTDETEPLSNSEEAEGSVK